jgi:hypothetical protein
MRIPVLVSVVTVCTLTAHAAHAQDPPRIGLTMGYPAAIGVLWQVAERVAVRPEVTAAKSSSETLSGSIGATTPRASPSNNWQIGAGVSALFYVSRADALRMYVAPRFAYLKTSTSTDLASASVLSAFDSAAYTTGGSFGGQYALGRRFALFGEVGVRYTSTTSKATTSESVTIAFDAGPSVFTAGSETHTHVFGTFSGAGVILFF